MHVFLNKRCVTVTIEFALSKKINTPELIALNVQRYEFLFRALHEFNEWSY